MKYLDAAAGAWSKYSSMANSTHGPCWTNRAGQVDLDELGREVRHYVEIARGPITLENKGKLACANLNNLNGGVQDLLSMAKRYWRRNGSTSIR